MRQLFLILTLLFLAGCTVTPTSVQLSLPVVSAQTPTADPFLVVEAPIIDAATHQPVAADLYVITGAHYHEPTSADLVARATQHFAIQLDPQSDSWIVVRAPGYQDWKLRFHYNLKTSRKLTGPVGASAGQGNDHLNARYRCQAHRNIVSVEFSTALYAGKMGSHLSTFIKAEKRGNPLY
jgi:hypothetical protein